MNLIKTIIRDFPVDIPEPPIKIKYLLTKKWFKPVRYGIPKKGEYSWNLDLLAFNDEPVIVYNSLDSNNLSWIYEEIQ